MQIIETLNDKLLLDSNVELAEHYIRNICNYDKKLLLIVGESRSGKSKLLKRLAHQENGTILNLNLELSMRLLTVPKSNRQLDLRQILHSLVLKKDNQRIVFIDNIEILFDADLKNNPIYLLEDLARHCVVVVTWSGSIYNETITYARPDHPEYRVVKYIKFPYINLNINN